MIKSWVVFMYDLTELTDNTFSDMGVGKYDAYRFFSGVCHNISWKQTSTSVNKWAD